MEICDLSAIALSEMLRDGRLSAVEVLDAVLARADQITAAVNPFTLRLDDRARKAAERADDLLRRGEGGQLCGVPVTTKDSHWMAGIPSASGSRTRADFVPSETVGPIARLEAAGAVIFARTAVPEFCYFGITESAVHGSTTNPWNPERTSGGSSGGAGAAVAAGAGPLSLGGDGGGSIRIPAAFCGIVGFKPTFGLIPHEPSTPGWKTLVAMGPMARSVPDARLMLRSVAGFDPLDRHSLPSLPVDSPAPDPDGLRVIVSEDLGFARLDDDVRRCFRDTVQRLSAAGVQVITDTPGLVSSVATWSAIAVAEARVSEAHELATQRDELSEPALAFILAGEQISTVQYIEAQFERERIHRAYVELFARTGASVLLTPTIGCEAFPLAQLHPASIGGSPIAYPDLDWAPLLYDANLAGLPACALPMGIGDEGLPISLQVTGLRCTDAQVLGAAETIERVIGFAERPPERGTSV